MNDLRFCKKCGKSFEPGDEFCTGCGASIEKKRRKSRMRDSKGKPPLQSLESIKFDVRLKCAIVGFLSGFTIFFIIFSLFFFITLNPLLAGLIGGVIFSVSAYAAAIALEGKNAKFLRSLELALPLFPKSGPVRKILDYFYSRSVARKETKNTLTK